MSEFRVAHCNSEQKSGKGPQLFPFRGGIHCRFLFCFSPTVEGKTLSVFATRARADAFCIRRQKVDVPSCKLQLGTKIRTWCSTIPAPGTIPSSRVCQDFLRFLSTISWARGRGSFPVPDADHPGMQLSSCKHVATHGLHLPRPPGRRADARITPSSSSSPVLKVPRGVGCVLLHHRCVPGVP